MTGPDVEVPAQRRPVRLLPPAGVRGPDPFHEVFRTALDEAPELIMSAAFDGSERVNLVADYYAHVLQLIRAHHEAEDELLWPRLAQTTPHYAGEFTRLGAQHGALDGATERARARMDDWVTFQSDDTAAYAATAIGSLGVVLRVHLDDEEELFAQLDAGDVRPADFVDVHLHTLARFNGEKLWLVLGLVGEQMRAEQVAVLNAQLPERAHAAGNQDDARAYATFISQLRS